MYPSLAMPIPVDRLAILPERERDADEKQIANSCFVFGRRAISG